MSEHSLLEYCSSLCCCLLKSASFLLVFWNASYKIFDVFCATWLSDLINVLMFLYFVEGDDSVVIEYSFATL